MLEVFNRINELTKKQKEEGLTKTELNERTELREEYLQIIRGQINTTVTGLKILDPLGNDVTPEKLKEQQKLSLSTDNNARKYPAPLLLNDSSNSTFA
ncbi:DUF896 domain-containing protein [Bacillus sp. ES1-5]|uniref:DUF896 domain-containing protein n=1 Tax=Bacillus sp. ES1-5 TaxID=1502999 RepID=UPI001F0C7606|nr:DUF896 domain-containing protein [Bacillus sp. ES1-5]